MTEPRRRRRVLCGLAALAGGLAGCSAAPGEGPQPAAEGSPTATETPTCRAGVHLTATALGEATVADVAGAEAVYWEALRGERRTAVVAREERSAVEAAVRSAGGRLLSATPVEWCGAPLCDATTLARFGTDRAPGDVASSFPDAVAVYAGDGQGLVYSTADAATLGERLAAAGVETATATVAALAACER
jgi:hypothetical protein